MIYRPTAARRMANLITEFRNSKRRCTDATPIANGLETARRGPAVAMDTDDRVRELEQRVPHLEATVISLRANLTAAWAELARIRAEQRAETAAMRKDHQEQTDQIMAAITANKVGAAAMNAGAKAIAWVFLALLSLGTAIAAIAGAARKWLPNIWSG